METKTTELGVIKLGLLGDSNVGKTSICNRYIGNEFREDMIATIGADKFEKKITLKNCKTIKLIFWDTVRQERFRSAAYKALRSVQGIILVFNLTCKSTFKNIENYL